MKGCALFKLQSEAKERVLAAFAAIDIRKNEVDSYTYNDANTLVTEIERILAEQLFEVSMDGMKGLLSTATNTLMEYKATISIKCKHVLKDSKDTAAVYPPAVARWSNQKSLQIAMPKKRRTGRRPTDWLQLGSKKEWQQESPRSSEKTSPTRSSTRQMESASNR